MSTYNPWLLVTIILGILWAWAEFRGLVAGWRGDRERDRLLDRIAAQTPGELERLDAHEARTLALSRTPKTTRPAKHETVPDLGAYEEAVWTPAITAAEGHEIVRDIAG